MYVCYIVIPKHKPHFDWLIDSTRKIGWNNFSSQEFHWVVSLKNPIL